MEAESTPRAPVEALLPYLPEDRKQASASGVALPDRSEGTALFADLSGFTSLTEALARAHGPDRGAEELTRHLTHAFDALIRPVHAQRGSVIGFSGDAVTCWFDGDDGRAAVAAAHAMQAAVAELPAAALPGADAVSFGAKVAVVGGPVRRLLVGDPAIQVIDVLAGSTLDRLAVCEGLAERGEVVVDPSVAQAAGVRVTSERTDPASGFVGCVVGPPEDPAPRNPWPALPEADVARLRPWVLPVVQERLRLGLDGSAADFRPAAALFLSFAGIDYDGDPDAGEKLDTFVRWVQGVVNLVGGSVIQLTVGDKGAYLYCAFGAPVAHEDDAARAVSAALTLRSPPHPFVRDVRIGVTHGRMYAGAYGSATRRTYGVLGPKTNLAARLMGRAEPGSVLCDEAIVRQARRRWTFTPLPPIRVKGVAQPVAVSAPVEPVAQEELLRPIAGRSSERDRLRDLAQRAVGGESLTLLIEGDVGIGKSRLVTWLARESEAMGARTLAGRPQSLEVRAPYGAWRDIVWGLLGLDGASSAERIESTARRVADLAPELAPWSPLLADLTGLDLPESDLTRALAPDVRHRNLTHLITELATRRASAVPLVVILDEAQRLDSLSWELAVNVAQAARERRVPFLLGLAYRPLEVGPTGGEALATLREPDEGVHTTMLTDLEPEAVTEIVAGVLDVPPAALPRGLADLVVGRASGNPFYAEELVATLVDDGSLRVERSPDGASVAFTGGAGDGALLPRTLQGLVLARVDRSSAEEQLTLKVASVVGRRFGLAPLRVALRSTAPVREEEVRGRLGALAARALVQPDGEAADAFAFRHVLVHEVAYGSLLFAQRRRLHRTVAEWYGREEDLPPRKLHPLLAHHYGRAAEGSDDAALVGRAVRYLQLTAEQNEHLSAFPEALAAFEAALALLPEDDEPAERRSGLLVAAAGVHEKMGAYREAGARFEEALRRPGSERNRAAALAGLCLVHTRGGADEEARAAGDRALEIAEAIQDATLIALVRGRLGILAALGGAFTQAEEHFASAERHYRVLDQLQNAAAWSNNLGLVLIFQERFDEAQLRLADALALARDARAKDVEAQVLMNLGLAAQRLEDLDTAAERYTESLELCRALLARQDAVTAVVNLGDIALARGRHDEAWDAYTGAADEAFALGAIPKALDALRGASEVLLVRGESVRAARFLGLVLRHPASNVEVETEAHRVLEVLKERLEEDDLDRALERGAARDLADVVAEVAPALSR